MSRKTRPPEIAPPPPPVEAPPAEPETIKAPPKWIDLTLRVIGGVIAVWAAAMLALLGVFLTPLHLGSDRAPVSLLLAVVGNAGLIWFAWKTTGHRFVSMLPGIVWLLIVALFGLGRPEGDLGLVQQNWVAMVYLLAGSITLGVAGFKLLAPPVSGSGSTGAPMIRPTAATSKPLPGAKPRKPS